MEDMHSTLGNRKVFLHSQKFARIRFILRWSRFHSSVSSYWTQLVYEIRYMIPSEDHEVHLLPQSKPDESVWWSNRILSIFLVLSNDGKNLQEKQSSNSIRHRTLNPLPFLMHKYYDFYRITNSHKTREEAPSRTSRKDSDRTDCLWEKWSWSVYLLPMDAIWQSICKGIPRGSLKMSCHDEWSCRVPASQGYKGWKYDCHCFLAQIASYIIW